MELLERSGPLSALRELVASAIRAAQGRLVLVAGLAGIGKTALLRQLCDGLPPSTHRLKLLEQENARLKKIGAEQALDISMLKDLQRGKWSARRGGETR